jgi:hypothetical protein
LEAEPDPARTRTRRREGLAVGDVLPGGPDRLCEQEVGQVTSNDPA